MRHPSFRAAAALVALAGLLAGCGDDEDAGSQGGSGPDGSLTVFAAASLTDAFDELGAAFEDTHPGVSVTFSYEGSASLRDQILAGAPADVFASANLPTMEAVVDGGGVDGEPEIFATNELAIAVPAGNEAGIDGLDDFSDESLLIGLCDEEVPCGEFGRRALANAGVTPAPDTNEPDVRSLLDKVASGDLDAGVVYVTDVEAAGDAVEGIAIPAEHNVAAEYPIATLATAENAEAAEAFVDFVLSDAGQDVLRAHGFGPPS
ncbi:MAG TPA: molybdate ABC transporter substrate-binding protein [Acidimicrobiales bacterium]